MDPDPHPHPQAPPGAAQHYAPPGPVPQYGAAPAAYDPAAPYPTPPPEPEPAAPDETKLWVLRVAKGVVFFIYVVVAFALVLLAMAFALRAFGANPEAGFAEWVYRQSDRLMEPFRGIFPTKQVNDTSVLDFSLLFAMVVYSILALLLHALVSWLADRVAMANRNVQVQQYRQEVERRRQEEMRYRAQQQAAQPRPRY
jgi:uncharacterized protein YggT (Ycf19 family)